MNSVSVHELNSNTEYRVGDSLLGWYPAVPPLEQAPREKIAVPLPTMPTGYLHSPLVASRLIVYRIATRRRRATRSVRREGVKPTIKCKFAS